MKKTILALIVLGCTAAFGQSFADLKDKKGRSLYEDNWFNVMARYTHVGGKYTQKVGGFTGNVSLRNANVEKGKMSWYYENPTLGDLIWLLVNSKKNLGNNEQAFGSGFLGWVHGYYNVIGKDKFILAPGISAGDYIFGSERGTGTQAAIIYEPYGYYLAAGPAIKTSYLINEDFWIDGTFNLDIAFTKTKKGYDNRYVKEDGYPFPMFASLHATLYHKSKFFLSVRGYQMIDRGDYNDSAQRWDVSVGYQILR